MMEFVINLLLMDFYLPVNIFATESPLHKFGIPGVISV